MIAFTEFASLQLTRRITDKINATKSGPVYVECS